MGHYSDSQLLKNSTGCDLKVYIYIIECLSGVGQVVSGEEELSRWEEGK